MKIIRLSIILFFLTASAATGQGNIFGTVSNFDATTPTNGEISFFGFINNTDEEIRIDNCVGAGYDNGNWFDDFQNYLTKTTGDPIDFLFYNLTNDEGYRLESVIEVGSFQQENISLGIIGWPSKPTGFAGLAIEGPAIELSWDNQSGLTYHIYRRAAESDGSFFRIDEPTGNLSNHGVTSPYIDNNVDGVSSYDYVIIADDGFGELGPHSDFIMVSSESYICGDTDNSGAINVLDIVYMINFKYKGGPAPVHIQSIDVNGDYALNILDVTYLINYKYKNGPDLLCHDDFTYP